MKKLKEPAGPWSNGKEKSEKNREIRGKVLLEQLWNLEHGKGLRLYPDGMVSILASKSILLTPKEWTCVYLPYKMVIEGGIIVSCGL